MIGNLYWHCYDYNVYDIILIEVMGKNAYGTLLVKEILPTYKSNNLIAVHSSKFENVRIWDYALLLGVFIWT
jgi:hypothetical protein